MDTNTRKIVSIILAGTLAVTVLLGVFVPDARDFLSELAKGLGVMLGGLVR